MCTARSHHVLKAVLVFPTKRSGDTQLSSANKPQKGGQHNVHTFDCDFLMMTGCDEVTSEE